jgi:Tfp pilus assembly protein PilN
MNSLKTVNLLPEWYRKELRQRKRLRRNLGLFVALGAVLAAGAHFSQLHLASVRAQHATLKAHAASVQDLTPVIAAMKADNDRLQDRKEACKELGAAVPMSKLMQQIFNEMPAGTAISRFSIEVKSEAIKGTGFVGDRQNPPKFHDVAHLIVVGVAKDDTQANTLFSELSKNPLFTEVTMPYLRREIVMGYEARRFELQLVMDLDRLAVETPSAIEDENASPRVEQQVRAELPEVKHGS